MLWASSLVKSYPPRRLFADVSVQLAAGRRVALVGGNGVGKTTLLEILAGIAEPDEGDVHRQSGLTLGYLPQELDDITEGTVLEATLAGAGDITAMTAELRSLEERLSDVNAADHDGVLARYGELEAHFRQIGGYGFEAEAHRVLAGLGFAPDDAQTARRAAVGRLADASRAGTAACWRIPMSCWQTNPPTTSMWTRWPGWRTSSPRGTAGCCSLATTATSSTRWPIASSRWMASSAHEHVGGFAEFVAAREERIAAAEAAAAAQSRRRAHTERFIERFRYKASKARQVQSRIKALDEAGARRDSEPQGVGSSVRVRHAAALVAGCRGAD